MYKEELAVHISNILIRNTYYKFESDPQVANNGKKTFYLIKCANVNCVDISEK